MMKNPERGFTLGEMTITMFILGLVAAISLPNVHGAIENFRLNAAARKMTSDIRYARELALSRHATYGISVNAASNTYSIFSLSGDVKTTITDPWKQKAMSFNFNTMGEYAGVQIGTVDFCENSGCPSVDLRFDSFGTPSDSSGTAMASAATVLLSASGNNKTINIHPETAFCEIV